MFLNNISQQPIKTIVHYLCYALGAIIFLVAILISVPLLWIAVVLGGCLLAIQALVSGQQASRELLKQAWFMQHSDTRLISCAPTSTLQVQLEQALADQRSLTARLAEAEAKLEQALAERQRLQAQHQESLKMLAGGVAHTFNNLLTGIQGNLGLALQDIDPQSPTAEALLDASQAARQAATTIRQMLVYAGLHSTFSEPIDLRESLDMMLPKFRSTLPSQIRLIEEYAAVLPQVAAQSAQLQQIVTSLLENAVESIGAQQGTIILSVQPLETFVDWLATAGFPDAEPGTYLMIEVRDTGNGMDATTMGRIFEPFFSTRFAGRGLGLAVVGGIVRSLGGTLRTESIVGAGTTITILLPVVPTELVGDSRGCVCEARSCVRGV